MASNHGAVAAALLLGAGLAMAPGVGPGVAEPGQSRIVGYVHNDDREDAVIVRPVGDTVRAGGRAFFDLRVAGNGPVYRVTVGPFDFMADGPWTTATTEQFLAATGTWDLWAPWP